MPFLDPAPATKVEFNDLANSVVKTAEFPETLGAQLAPPIVSLSTIPNTVNAEKWWNSQPNQQDNPTTWNGFQFVAWYDKAKRPMIGKRLLPNGDWTVYDLDRISGQPLGRVDGTFGTSDNHNYLSIGVDGSGRVHVAGNQHGNVLRYVRSAAGGDITSWTTGTMIGTQESNMSYPAFIPLLNGDMLFTYRDGGSGWGDTFLNKWDDTAGSWSRIGMLFAGKHESTGEVSLDENFYPNHHSVAPDGTVHIHGAWRTGGALSDQTNDIVHIKSTDNGTTWRSITGTVLTLPIKHGTSPIVLDTIPQGSGLQSTSGHDVDADGNPHAAWLKYDSSGRTQIYHVYWDGSAWHVEQVTNFGRREELSQPLTYGIIGRPAIACTGSGRTFIVYRSAVDGRRGSLRMIEVTPGATVRECSILDLDTYYWEPAFDMRAAHERDELHMLVVPTAPQYDDPTFPEIGNPSNWAQQAGFVLSVDLGRADQLLAGTAPVPGMRVIDRATANASISVTATTATAIGPMLTVDPALLRLRDRTVMVRLRARAAMASGADTGQLQLMQGSDDGQAAIMLATRSGSAGQVSGTTAKSYVTPWVPMQVAQRIWKNGGYLYANGLVSAGTMTVSALTIEVGLIVDSSGAPARRRRAHRTDDAISAVGPIAVLHDPAQVAGNAADGDAQQYLFDAMDQEDYSAANVSQSTAANRALYKPNEMNGKPVLRFDGTNDSYSSDYADVYLQSGSFSLFAVVKNVTAPGSGRSCLYTLGAKIGGRQLVVTSAGKFELQCAKTSTLVTGATTIGASARVLIATYDHTTGTATLNVDGADDGTATVTPPTWIDQGCYVGYQANDGNSFFNGDLALVGALGCALDAAGRLALARALGARYGVTVA